MVSFACTHCTCVFTVCVCCADVNECLDRNGGCNQGCNNTEGSFYCYCNEGHTLHSNGFFCEGEYKVPDLLQIGHRCCLHRDMLIKSSLTYHVLYVNRQQ